MSVHIWGPALDAELDYRRSRLREDLARDRGATERRRVRRAARPRGPARRWFLPGSGAWHAAR